MQRIPVSEELSKLAVATLGKAAMFRALKPDQLDQMIKGGSLVEFEPVCTRFRNHRVRELGEVCREGKSHCRNAKVGYRPTFNIEATNLGVVKALLFERRESRYAAAILTSKLSPVACARGAPLRMAEIDEP